MEFDILNEILTGTVAQLFTNKTAHSNFFKTTSEMGGLRSEIPLGKPVSIGYEEEEKKEIGPFFAPAREPTGEEHAQPTSQMTPAQWLATEGKRRLEESMRKLKLDKAKISGKTLANYTHDELLQEKKNVKNELKAYDSKFIKEFNKQPGRSEKEPMRPLYMFYKKLKVALSDSKKAGGRKEERKGAGPAAGGTSNLLTGGGLSSANSSGSMLSGIVSSATEGEEEERKGKVKGVAGVSVGGASAPKVAEEASEAELKQQVSQLKKERMKLRSKLDEFQKNFQQANNRKIRYTKDIAPVS